jgi:integrase
MKNFEALAWYNKYVSASLYLWGGNKMRLSLEKRPNSYYYILIDRRKEGLNKQYQSTGTTKKREAETKLEEVRQKLTTQKDATGYKTYFLEYYKEWLNTYVKKNCRQTTAEGYKLIFKAHVEPYFETKNCTLTNLKTVDIQRFYNYKLESGLSSNTVIRFHANIRKMLDYAKKMGLITLNPAENCVLPKRKKFYAKIYNREQVFKLMEAITGTTIETSVILAYSLGMRRSEIAGLKWENVDLLNSKLLVCNTRTKLVSEVEDDTKNDSSRRVLALPAHIQQYLTKLRNNNPESEYVCLYEGKPIGVDYISKTFQK